MHVTLLQRANEENEEFNCQPRYGKGFFKGPVHKTFVSLVCLRPSSADSYSLASILTWIRNGVCGAAARALSAALVRSVQPRASCE